MAKIITDNQHYIDIASKIREKAGTSFTYKPSEMPSGIEQVYEKGYFDGGSGSNSGGSTGPIIQKQISGNPISLTDVSEIEHYISIQLTSETLNDFSNIQIKTCGKNLIDLRTALIGKAISGAGAGSIIYAATKSTNVVIPYIRVQPDTSYTFSLDNTDYWLNRICQMDKDNKCVENHAYYVNSANDYSSRTIRTRSETTWLALGLIKKSGDQIASLSDLEVINLQFERKSYISEFELYHEDVYDCSSNGLIGDVKSYIADMNILPVEKVQIDSSGQINPTQTDLVINLNYHQMYGIYTERENFWDSLQKNGARDNYSYAFQYYTDDMFHPKYDITPTNFAQALAYTQIGNLKKILQDANITLDLSQATNVLQCFRNSTFTHLPKIDLSNIKTTGVTYLFYFCQYLHTIDKIIITDKITSYEGFLSYCNSLRNVQFDGVISASGLNFSQSKFLSKESITNIITHLSQTASGLSITFSKDSVNVAFESEIGLKNGSESQEWGGLLEQYASNWTITLS